MTSLGALVSALGDSKNSTLRVQAPDVKELEGIHPKGGLPLPPSGGFSPPKEWLIPPSGGFSPQKGVTLSPGKKENLP